MNRETGRKESVCNHARRNDLFMRKTLVSLKGLLAIILIIVGSFAGQNVLATMTNSIPQGIFLTDDGFLFLYKGSGERVVDLRKIQAASSSLQSAPADRDPEDNWGQATNGLQVSLRLEKSAFTNAEQIFATSLVRNVTDEQQTYYRPVKFLLSKDGKALKRKGEDGLMEINASPFHTLYPQTQNKYKENLSQEYDLSSGGNYEVQAICRQPYVTSQTVKFLIAK